MAKFDNPISAQEMAVKIISEQNKAGGNYIQNRQQDAENSGANGVQGAAPEGQRRKNSKNVFDAPIDKLFPDEIRRYKQMGEYAVEKREITPKNFFAGDFPTVPETGTANAAIKEYAPVMIDTANDNKIIPVAKGSEAKAQSVLLSGSRKRRTSVTYYIDGVQFSLTHSTLKAGQIRQNQRSTAQGIDIFLR